VTELGTQRLLLRQWRDADRGPWAEMNADPEVMEHFLAPLSRREADEFVDAKSRVLDERGWGLWAVEVVDGPPFIGFVGLDVPSFEAEFTPAADHVLSRHVLYRVHR